jgi:hypothetical protein
MPARFCGQWMSRREPDPGWRACSLRETTITIITTTTTAGAITIITITTITIPDAVRRSEAIGAAA